MHYPTSKRQDKFEPRPGVSRSWHRGITVSTAKGDNTVCINVDSDRKPINRGLGAILYLSKLVDCVQVHDVRPMDLLVVRKQKEGTGRDYNAQLYHRCKLLSTTKSIPFGDHVR
jgi:hypothetical protein